MSKSLVGSVLLVLSVICFVNGETSVKVTAPQKNPGELYLVNACVNNEREMKKKSSLIDIKIKRNIAQIKWWNDFD